MKTRKWFFLTMVVILGMLLVPGYAVLAQDPPPVWPPSGAAPGGSLGPHEQQAAALRAADKGQVEALAAGQGGPVDALGEVSAEASDGFGYTSKNVAFTWIEAAAGTQLNFSPDDILSVDLPFPFKFYDNSYLAVRVAKHGYLTFSQYPGAVGQSSLLVPDEPNNLIAPYWTWLFTDENRNIFTTSGGTAPNRYVVFEWSDVGDLYTAGDNHFTFEVVLFENGNILFAYKEMLYTWSMNYATAGIEDSTGTTGLITLRFSARQKSNSAVLITRPTANTALKLYPNDYGAFTSIGGTAVYHLRVKNAGELPDIYNLFIQKNNKWPAVPYAADGVTRLIDTNNDGKVDTGMINPGETAEVVIQVTAPSRAKIGDSKLTTVTFISSVKPSRRKAAALTTTIPAPFTQGYAYDYLDQDGDVAASNFTPYLGMGDFTVAAHVNGYNPAVARLASQNGVYAWSQYACPERDCEEVFYSMTKLDGMPLLAATGLAVPPAGTWDYDVKVAAADDGNFGLTFVREVRQPDNTILYNVYFALFDSNGALLAGPTNVTGNASTDVSLYNPTIASLHSNYYIAYEQASSSDSTNFNDIVMAIYKPDGTLDRAPFKVTEDPGRGAGYYTPSVAVLANDRLLVAYNGWKAKGRSWTEYAFYTVLADFGGSIKFETGIPLGRVDSHGMDSIRLTNGQILMAWNVNKNNRETVYYAVLKDGSYTRVKGPVGLAARPAVTGCNRVAVTRDTDGHGIITWADDYASFGRHLYYALVGKNGTLLTKPVIFMTAEENSYLYMKSYGSSSMTFPFITVLSNP